MNNTLERYARKQLKKKSRGLSEAECQIFKKMYSPDNTDKDMDDVIDDMPDEKLDWALTQVENTIYEK